MGQLNQPSLLDQTTFEDYETSWVNIISDNNPAVLGPLFLNSSPLLTATLPVGSLLQLVSAVGVSSIKIAFVVRPTAPQNESAFTLVLYASDDRDNRLSAYYVANTAWGTPAATGTPPSPAAGGPMPVPAKLADLWQQQWMGVSTITADFFRVSAGVLQGYQYDVSHFVQALLAVSQFDDKKLRLDFGLHEYYGPDAPTVPDLTRTFGLVAYLADGHEMMVSAPYDMARPRPPAVSCN